MISPFSWSRADGGSAARLREPTPGGPSLTEPRREPTAILTFPSEENRVLRGRDHYRQPTAEPLLKLQGAYNISVGAISTRRNAKREAAGSDYCLTRSQKKEKTPWAFSCTVTSLGGTRTCIRYAEMAA